MLIYVLRWWPSWISDRHKKQKFVEDLPMIIPGQFPKSIYLNSIYIIRHGTHNSMFYSKHCYIVPIFMPKKCGFPHKIPNLDLPFFNAFLNCAQYMID